MNAAWRSGEHAETQSGLPDLSRSARHAPPYHQGVNWDDTRAGGTPATGPAAAASQPAVRPRRRWRRAAGTPEDLALSPDLALAAVAALRVGVVVLDTGDHPVLANASAREMGLVRPGASGLAAHPVVGALAAQVRAAGGGREIELELPRPAGSSAGPIGVRLHASALGEGHVTVEAVDVTETHRLARVRRDFVANVSHELKTPVGALALLAEALMEATGRPDGDSGQPARPGDDSGQPARPGGDSEAARRFAERIQKESLRLGKLVAELLELSRLQGAEPLAQPVPVSVDRIVAEVVDRTRIAAASKGILVGLSGTRGLAVSGNENQLTTAVGNLVENAIAYSPEGTRVAITTAATPDAVEIAVADQGIGIDPADLDRIFERFYRVDRARSRATGGTGLGLAIVKHIATNHGGRVDVVSRVGAGSTFTLRLPAAVRTRAPAPAQEGWRGGAGTRRRG